MKISNKVASQVIADLQQSLMRGIKQNIKDVENIKKKSDKGKSLMSDIDRELKTVKSALEKISDKDVEKWKVETAKDEIQEIEENLKDIKLVNYNPKFIENICDEIIKVWEMVEELMKKVYSKGKKETIRNFQEDTGFFDVFTSSQKLET